MTGRRRRDGGGGGEAYCAVPPARRLDRRVGGDAAPHDDDMQCTGAGRRQGRPEWVRGEKGGKRLLQSNKYLTNLIGFVFVHNKSHRILLNCINHASWTMNTYATICLS